jgi:hypothetical protein
MGVKFGTSLKTKGIKQGHFGYDVIMRQDNVK